MGEIRLGHFKSENGGEEVLHPVERVGREGGNEFPGVGFEGGGCFWVFDSKEITACCKSQDDSNWDGDFHGEEFGGDHFGFELFVKLGEVDVRGGFDRDFIQKVGLKKGGIRVAEKEEGSQEAKGKNQEGGCPLEDEVFLVVHFGV